MVLAALARSAAAVPFSDLSVFGDALGAFVGGALRVRRSHVERSMKRAGVRDFEERARGMYRSLGTSVLELLWLAGARREIDRFVRFDARARDALIEARRSGIVFAASHTGNWDLAACAVASRAPLLVVTKHLSLGFVDTFWQRSRASYGITLASAEGALTRGRAHVASHGAVAMMIDQVPMKRAHAVETTFLGERIWVDRAPATLAARAGVTLAVSASRRCEDGLQELTVLDVITPPRRATRDWIDEATVRATDALERFVLANPSEWLWMHRRWKTPPA